MTGTIIAAAALLLTLGATVKGLIGIGLPMIAVPGLSLIIGLPQALAVASLPVLVANLWQVWQFRKAATEGRIVPMFIAAGAAGVVAGTLLLVALPEALLELTLSVMLVAYILSRISAPDLRLPGHAARILALPLGLIAGVLHGATGISGPIGITFFHAQRPDRSRFAFATGAMFAGFTLVQVAMLGGVGILGPDALTAGLVGLPAVALGLWLGNRLAAYVNPRQFDRIVLVVLAWTAIALLWRGVSGLLAGI